MGKGRKEKKRIGGMEKGEREREREREKGRERESKEQKITHLVELFNLL